MNDLGEVAVNMIGNKTKQCVVVVSFEIDVFNFLRE